MSEDSVEVSDSQSVSVETEMDGVTLEAYAEGDAYAGAGFEVTDHSVAIGAEAGVEAGFGASASTTVGDADPRSQRNG